MVAVIVISVAVATALFAGWYLRRAGRRVTRPGGRAGAGSGGDGGYPHHYASDVGDGGHAGDGGGGD